MTACVESYRTQREIINSAEEQNVKSTQFDQVVVKSINPNPSETNAIIRNNGFEKTKSHYERNMEREKQIEQIATSIFAEDYTSSDDSNDSFDKEVRATNSPPKAFEVRYFIRKSLTSTQTFYLLHTSVFAPIALLL